MAKNPRQAARSFRDAFFTQNPNAQEVMNLFKYLSTIYFYAKDSDHRYIGVNQPTLTGVFGLNHEDDLLGRTDSEFQPPVLAEAYHAEDRRVMRGRKTIANQVWLVPHVRGTPRWFVSTKTPLFDPQKQVVGIAGVMYPIETPDEQALYFHELRPVVDHIDRHFNQNISMMEMAGMAGLSSTQFNYRFRTILRMSPTEYLLSRRIEYAQRLLAEGSMTIADVGIAVGFFDQSHFTKRFRKATGLTPLAYRKRFRGQGDSQ